MFGDVAIRLLKLMGHSGTVPGALLAEDVPRSLERLRRAVEEEHESDSGATDRANGAGDGAERVVSMSQRAYPLIELLDAAAHEGCNVMWSAVKS
jgi:Domain of unknown function (DUF1840)